jgi:hypothetical protein
MPIKNRFVGGKFAQKNTPFGIQKAPAKREETRKTAPKGIPVTEIQLQNGKRTGNPYGKRGHTLKMMRMKMNFISKEEHHSSPNVSMHYCTSLCPARQASCEWKALKIILIE